jgi:hypothetical protein
LRDGNLKGWDGRLKEERPVWKKNLHGICGITGEFDGIFRFAFHSQAWEKDAVGAEGGTSAPTRVRELAGEGKGIKKKE